jgi:hypothetical protein
MNKIENLRSRGRLSIVITDQYGQTKEKREVDNLVVNAGLAYITSRMVGTASSVMSHMAVGSGTATAAAANTDLGNLLGSRKALTSTTISGTNNESVVYVGTFNPGEGTGAITEAGIFNAASSGDMLCRTVFAVVNKAATDTMVITWTITLSAV